MRSVRVELMEKGVLKIGVECDCGEKVMVGECGHCSEDHIVVAGQYKAVTCLKCHREHVLYSQESIVRISSHDPI